MATHRQLIGSVTGPPGPQGDDGEQGTRWFYVTASASAAPANARIGDIVVNGGAATYTIGTRSLAVGQFSYITSIAPSRFRRRRSAVYAAYRVLPVRLRLCRVRPALTDSMPSSNTLLP